MASLARLTLRVLGSCPASSWAPQGHNLNEKGAVNPRDGSMGKCLDDHNWRTHRHGLLNILVCTKWEMMLKVSLSHS